MPDWVNYYTDYDSHSTYSSFAIAAQHYQDWIQQCEQQDRAMEQMMYEAAELEEEKRKYPLFFLKEGIV